MSVERELSTLNEAVAWLKEDRKDTHAALVRIEGKLDKHLESYAKLNFKFGKVAGTVALVVSLLIAGAKEALARMFR